MANVKNLSRRISSLRNMQKVMKAMNMIATVKLGKLFALQEPLGLFGVSRERIVSDLIDALVHRSHPAVAGYEATHRIHVVVFTADKGLCGAHNSSVQRATDALIDTNRRNRIEAELTCIGSKGSGYCSRKGYEIVHRSEIGERTFDLRALLNVTSSIYDRFRRGAVQAVYAVYNRFVSTLHQETMSARLVPLAPPDREEPRGQTPDFNSEPGIEDLADPAAELCLYFALQEAFANSLLSEQAARMTAMENATNNSEDLINRYVTMQNRARQDAITREIIEIISGKEAMEE